MTAAAAKRSFTSRLRASNGTLRRGSARWRWADESGITLAEMAVTTALLSVVLAMAYGAMWSGVTSGTSMQQRTDMLAATRLSLDTLQRDLRQAYTGDPTIPVIESLSATQISFFSPDRQTPAHVRRIIYRLNGASLERSELASTNTNGPPWTFGAAAPFKVVLKDVVNAPIFAYRDASGAATTVPGAVRTVDLTIDVGASSKPSPQRHTLSINLRSAM